MEGYANYNYILVTKSGSILNTPTPYRSPSSYTNVAAFVRFNSSGKIDARNGSVFQAKSSIPYVGGTTYHFRLVVNFPNRTYSVYVRPPGGSEQTIGTNYAFRSDWSDRTVATSLNYLAMFATNGSETVCNLNVR